MLRRLARLKDRSTLSNTSWTGLSQAGYREISRSTYDLALMEEHRRILELAEAGDLPASIDSTAGVDLNIFVELYEAGMIECADASTLTAPAYLNPRITLRGREYLSSLRKRSTALLIPEAPDRRGAVQLRLFISHTSSDADLAEAVVGLLSSALKLSSRDIRCTSVDGYRLPGGADTDEQLRTEAQSANAFIGIISPEGLKSQYVLFELGARWGAVKPLIPLLAPGTPPSIMRGPLAGLNALTCDNPAQLHQLVSDVAATLRIIPESAAVYGKQIEKIRSTRSAAQSDQEPQSTQVADDLSEETLRVLVALSKLASIPATPLAGRLGLTEHRTRYHLDLLHDRDLAGRHLFVGEPAEWYLTSEGRRFLFGRGLLQ